jgi:branched-chain amino acid transport system permease protein
MTRPWRGLLRPEVLVLLLLAVYPLLDLDRHLFRLTQRSLGSDLIILFIYAILALGLNVVLGYTGILHLGIAAFFGAGAVLTGILTVPTYPFQLDFFLTLLCAMAGAALLGLLLGTPTLRLRGDYLALVTLGFGEVVRFAFKNLEGITNGARGLNPVPPPPTWLALGWDWYLNYQPFYYLTLGLLALVLVLLVNLERSRLGRAWMAIREDELAATCMGVPAARVKLSAFALGAALAGLAGCLYGVRTTAIDPNTYDFNCSVLVLCCVIVGGLASLRGTVLGVLLLVGFDRVLAPMLDGWIQPLVEQHLQPRINEWLQEDKSREAVIRLLTFSNWRLLVYGVALILMIRFRPEGLLPSARVREEIREGAGGPLAEGGR